MPSAIKERQENLLKVIGEALKGDGFRRREQDFILKESETVSAVHLSFIPHRPIDFDFTVDFAVRHNRVEKIIESWYAYKEQKRTNIMLFTIGIEYGNLIGIGQKRWTVDTEEAVEEMGDQVLEVIKTKGFSYFQRFRNLSEVLSVMLSDNPRENLNCPFLSSRAERIPIIAALLGDKAKAREQFLVHYDLLKSKDDLLAPEYPEFARFVCKELSFDCPL